MASSNGRKIDFAITYTARALLSLTQMDHINNEIDFDSTVHLIEEIVNFINWNYNTDNLNTNDIAEEILDNYGRYNIDLVLEFYFPLSIDIETSVDEINRIISSSMPSLREKIEMLPLQKKFPIFGNVFSWGGGVYARGWRKFKGELVGEELFKAAQACVDTYNQRANHNEHYKNNSMMVLEPVNTVVELNGDKKAIVAITYRRQLYEFIFFSERGHTFLASLYCRGKPMSIEWPGHKLWIQTIYDLLGDRNLEIDDVYFKE